MKKLLLISMLIGAMPLAMMAQDDDLYFVPKKKKVSKVEQVKEIAPVVAPQPKAKSSYEVIDGDTTNLDVIDFTEGKGVYPTDTLETEDYAITKNMVRFDDYDVSSNAAFWAGYRAGASTWAWHSPWYYSRYGWYDPWYYGSWYGSVMWNNPYYLSWWDPYYYGWYDPYWSSWGWPYYGYYSLYHSPYYYWGYPYYYIGGGGGSHRYYANNGNAGSINVNGSTSYRPSHRNTVTTNSSRMGSLRERASQMGGNRVYTSGNTQRSSSGNFSGRRGGDNNYSSPSRSSSNMNYSSPSRSSSGSFSSGSSSSGSFGGTRSSGGGGGGGRAGGRR